MSFRFCPHCGKELPAPSASAPARQEPPPVDGRQAAGSGYDQTSYWRALHARIDADADAAPPETEALVAALVQRLPASPRSLQPSIVHLIFNRPITPAGGALLQSVLSDGRLGPSGDLERLQQLGYALEDGRVKQVNGMPVGRAYGALDYWGGERQHKRWHLAERIRIDPSRHGDRFFMDERSLAFGAVWRDLDRFAEAMAALIDLFRGGIDGPPIAEPLLVDLHWGDDALSRE
jgi:hypothetical protein